MDLKQIKLIIDLMKRSDLTEFAVEEEGFKLKICRSAGGTTSVTTPPLAGSRAPFIPGIDMPLPTPPAVTVPNTAAAAAENASEAGVTFVKSPMVGTFYRSASPESKVFVEAGSKISENSVVCIIEAMKIMNEIQAEVKGTVIEALVENGQPVEYGQKLFKISQA